MVDAPLDEQCLDDHSMNFFEDAMYIFAGDHSRGDWADAMGHIMNVLANLNTCQFRKPFKDMISFCRTAHNSEETDESSNLLAEEFSNLHEP